VNILRKDRRLARRYEIELDLRIVVMAAGGVAQIGTGRSCNLSSGGVLFESATPLPVGAHVELWIRWPAPTDRIRPLTLIANGIVVRKHEDRYGLNLVRHEFSACHYQDFLERLPGMQIATPSNP
jgi:hypothetical protein